MKENIRSELFFLKQFGFSSALLQHVFLLGLDPIDVIFYQNSNQYELKRNLTKKETKLSMNIIEYKRFKIDLFKNEELLRKNTYNKIFFKYDENELTKLIPNQIMPLFMYAKGDHTLLSESMKRVAIIGTRQPSDKAIRRTELITKKYVKDNYVIVSGLAEGIDTISHNSAIDNGGKTIAVLPTNFNNIYPSKNKKLTKKILNNGLLMTSIGPKENTYKSSFLERNKYVANISDLVIVTETNLKSGTMNTIRNASEANKKILFFNQDDEAINEKIYKFGGEMLDE